MPVSFARINAREYRHRCFIFMQLQALSKSNAGGRITGLKKAVKDGTSRLNDPKPNDPTMVFVIAHRMDTSGDTRKVRYTTLFSISNQFYIFQADPAKDDTFSIAMCAKLTAQQFANFVASFARDAEERFGYQDARMNEVAAQNNAPAPVNEVEFYSGGGEQMMPAVIAPANDYAKTQTQVGGQTGFMSNYGQRIPAPSPPGPASFAQGMQQVASGAAEEIYMA